MNVARRLLPYVRPYRLRFIQAAAAMVVVAAVNGATVYLLKPIIDQALISKDFRWLWLAIVGVPALIALKTAAGYVQNYLMSWIGQRATQTLREELFRHLHTLSLDYYAENKSAEVLARVTNDLSNVQSSLQFLPLYLIRDTLTIFALMTVLFYLNWRFAFIALLSIPVASVALVILGRKMRDSSMQSQVIMGQIYHRFQESLQGMLLIKAFNYEEGAVEKFRGENLSFFVQTMRYLRATALSGPLMELCGALILSVLLYYGGREIIVGRMTTGDFFAFLAAFFAAYSPTKNLARLNSELQRGLASGERMFQLLDERPTVLERPDSAPFTGLKSLIRFDRVSFRYPSREQHALRDVAIEVHRGERVAIVGPSGSGKSTLVYLLLRLYDPAGGRILLDNADLRELDLRSVRGQVGLVTQETVLFNETVFQNVAIGRRSASPEDVARACRIADAHDFIESLPQGYQTQLGDRGMKLSGGQRQRLAIARAVLKNPSLLVLDEATSNLDSTSEGEVQSALERLMEGRTTLVIAHRLSTVRSADRIYVLREGTVAECGTHAQLIERDGVYRRLYEIQKAEPPQRPDPVAPAS
ncbi:MAG: ABC transporter ATP-binding protein [Elusimicrobia bacterium]|nr:ABC transporter ATP-binding protein [Elusimicrobiota bacterium]